MEGWGRVCAMPNCAWALLLALCSRIISGDAQGTICSIRNPVAICKAQNKNLNVCSVRPHQFYILFDEDNIKQSLESHFLYSNCHVSLPFDRYTVFTYFISIMGVRVVPTKEGCLENGQLSYFVQISAL